MQRFSLVAVLVLLLPGCADLFDANVYTAVDAPPALNTGALSKLSTSDIRQLAGDSSFYTQLKSDPAALAAVQTALNNALTNATTTQDKIDAATTLVEVTANSTAIAEIKANAVTNIATIQDALKIPDYGKALKIFLGNETDPAKVKASLTQLVTLSDTLETMQTISKKTDNTIDPDIFFAGTSDPAGFAQTALMAAVTRALVTDLGVAAPKSTSQAAALTKTAAELVKDTPVFPAGGADIKAFGNAKGSNLAWNSTGASGATGANNATLTYTLSPDGYSYAYVYAVVSKMALGF